MLEAGGVGMGSAEPVSDVNHASRRVARPLRKIKGLRSYPREPCHPSLNTITISPPDCSWRARFTQALNRRNRLGLQGSHRFLVVTQGTFRIHGTDADDFGQARGQRAERPVRTN